jgi:hypothetical protein
MIKNGFLFVELSIGLTLLTILIFIITHYIIEVKNVQQRTLLRMEALTIVRNAAEKVIAHNYIPTIHATPNNQFAVNFEKLSPAHTVYKQKNKVCGLHSTVVTWKINNKHYSLSLPSCVLEKEYDKNNESNNV